MRRLLDPVEAIVQRTARAARCTPRAAALKLAEHRERQTSHAVGYGWGSARFEAAALRGVALHLAATGDWRGDLQAVVEAVARDMGANPASVALAAAGLLESGAFLFEPRADGIGHLRLLARMWRTQRGRQAA